MYKLYAKLFGIEGAFRLSVFSATLLNRIPFARPLIKLFHKSPESMRTEALDMIFENPVGLGPGLDKNGLLYDIYAARGFSYVNIGPLDTEGVKTAISHIQNNPPDTIVSCCINAEHQMAFSLAYDFVDMFVVEIADDDITDVLELLLDIRLTYDSYKPILLRITHEIPEMDSVLDFCRLNGIDGFVANGTKLVERINQFCNGRVPIVGYGNITTAEDARKMREAGARLIEITTGYVLEGASIVPKILKGFYQQ